MGIPRSTFYDAPSTTADETAIVEAISGLCDAFEQYG